MYAVWVPVTVTLKFDANNGEFKIGPSARDTQDSLEVAYGDPLPGNGLKAPTRAGYTFTGYFSEKIGGTQYYNESLDAVKLSDLTVDTTLYAQWKANSYQLVYKQKKSDGSIIQIATQDVVFANNVTLYQQGFLEAHGLEIRAGYKLSGWDDSINSNNTVYQSGSTFTWEEPNSLVVYAVTKSDTTYKLSYNANGGMGGPVSKENIEPYESIDLDFDNIPILHGYEFLGWDLNPSKNDSPIYTKDDSSIKMPDENVELYAIWGIKSYTIKYNENTGSWNEESNAEDGNISSVVEYYSKSAELNSGNGLEKPGYTLTGWGQASGTNNSKTYNLGDEIATNLTNRDSITLYGVWEANEIKVGYDSLGGSKISDSIVKYNQIYNSMQTPNREGYSFDGWYLSYNPDNDEYANKIISGSTRVSETKEHLLFAKWNKKNFTVHYPSGIDSTETSFDSDFILSNGEGITGIPADKALLGWSKVNGGGVDFELGENISSNMLWNGTNDVTLYAVLKSITVNVSFETDGGNDIDSMTFNYGSRYTELPTAVKEGYDFDGWYLDSQFTNKVNSGQTIITTDVDHTLFAKWNEINSGQTGGSGGGGGGGGGGGSASGGGNASGGAVTEGVGEDTTGTVDANTQDDSTQTVNEETTSKKFTDVKSNDWFESNIYKAVENGWFSGTSKNTFSPYATTTRGMIATVIYNMENKPSVSFDNLFSDVKEDAYYAQGISWAKANGVIQGYGDGTFGPENAITREQLASILYSFAKYKGFNTNYFVDISYFSDVDQVSEYAIDAMKWAVANKLILGKDQNNIDPKNYATRAEVVTILINFANQFGMI